MNIAAFAVVIARARETGLGDSVTAFEGLGASNPFLAWPMTIAMLGLAGIPGTAGFVGKFFLIDASVDGDYTWLGIVIVIGSAISLAYYLRIIATMWMKPAPRTVPAVAGASSDIPLDEIPTGPRPAGIEVTIVAVVCGAATLVLGIVPGPVMDVAQDAATALGRLL
jgi:NADH-quinone oxidoreductase subunit N